MLRPLCGPGVAGWTRPLRGAGGPARVCGGAAPDPPLKRAGSSRLRGGGRYHPPPGGAHPPRGQGGGSGGSGSRRVLGCSDCSISRRRGVCVFGSSPALSAGEGGARGGLRDAAEPGEPGGSPVEMPLVPLQGWREGPQSERGWGSCVCVCVCGCAPEAVTAAGRTLGASLRPPFPGHVGGDTATPLGSREDFHG